jgi:hypothetical protein
MTPSEVTLLTDKQWSAIDGELCRATKFDDTISHIDKYMPYASIEIECRKMPNKIKGFITHKIDYKNLKYAFRERTIKENEEVLISWTVRNYTHKIYSFFSYTMPKLRVMICPKGAFELEVDPNYKPELKGEARWNATKPIVDWKPEVMK